MYFLSRLLLLYVQKSRKADKRKKNVNNCKTRYIKQNIILFWYKKKLTKIHAQKIDSVSPFLQRSVLIYGIVCGGGDKKTLFGIKMHNIVFDVEYCRVCKLSVSGGGQNKNTRINIHFLA